MDAENRENVRPIDLTPYNSETWGILHEASAGEMPELEEICEVPIVPDYAIAGGTTKKKKKGGKRKKGKGKKGKKSGKKSGKRKRKK